MKYKIPFTSLFLLGLTFIIITSAFASTHNFHVYQYDKYLNTFKSGILAIEYAKQYDHTKVISEDVNDVFWHNYCYHVYQNNVYLNSFDTFEEASNYAIEYKDSSIVDGLTQNVTDYADLVFLNHFNTEEDIEMAIKMIENERANMVKGSSMYRATLHLENELGRKYIRILQAEICALERKALGW